MFTKKMVLSVLIVAMLMGFASFTFAQVMDKEVDEEIARFSILRYTKESFFGSGAIFMWAILVVSVFGLAIIVERIVYFMKATRIHHDDVFDEIVGFVRAGKVKEAKEFALDLENPIGYIAHAALEHVGNKDENRLKSSVLEVQLTEEPLINKRLAYLAVVANIATLLGLLGTIIGLIMAFYAVSNVPASQRTAALAIGIQVAMATTAFGLIIAIPTLAVYGFISATSEKVLNGMDEIATRMINYVSLVNQKGVS